MHDAAAFSSLISDSDSEISDSESEDVFPTLGSPLLAPEPDEGSGESPAREEDKAQDGEIDDVAIIHARAYQLEMFEESLKRNIIVAMDTGTGKTQVAVLRIKAELDMSPPEKLVWFLAPTVALCIQQLDVLRTQIRSVQMKLLSGADGCDTWSEPRIWDDFLRNVRVVVSTHQVLYDAISHAFVGLDRLSLIVFDEAHGCTGNHPGSKIMARYHCNKDAGLPVPAILGLTATPIMKSKPEDLEVIERTLDAVCKSPSIHRDQLISTVKRPNIECVLHQPRQSRITYTRSMASLVVITQDIDIFTDPEVIRLHDENTERSRAILQKVLQKGNTKSSIQMQSLCRKSIEVWHEIGGWAADYFIYTAITQFLVSVRKNDEWFETWSMMEKQYLAGLLRQVEIESIPTGDSPRTSEKVKILVRKLLASPENTTGIIFAKQTATVAALAHILSVLPSMKSRFRVGSMFGTSQASERKRKVGEFYREDEYYHLTEFQNGRINLLVATSVLEEGIDIPACNLVICFDPPANLKSFIQRRGRARAEESRLIMFFPEDLESKKYEEWTELEQEMKKKYEDELRELGNIASIEDEEIPEILPLRIEKTGAQLDFDQAKSHLEHVCSALSSRQYVDTRPYYLTHETQVSQTGPPIIESTVVLPVSFPPHLRRFKGSRAWYSEKNATKDAAFQAFVALYEAGLVNDHLMPLRVELEGARDRAAMVEINELWSPWPGVARSWDAAMTVNMRQLRVIDQDGQLISEFSASLPGAFPDIPAFNLYWDKSNLWKVEVGQLDIVGKSSLKPDQSMSLVDLAYGHRLEVKNLPCVLHLQSSHDLPFEEMIGRRSIEETTLGRHFLIRFDGKVPYFYQSWLPSRPSLDLIRRFPRFLLEEPVDAPWLALESWSPRKDILHPAIENGPAAPSTKPYQKVRPMSRCRVDSVHVSFAQFGALIPTITHMIENYLIADELRRTILRESPISDLSSVVTAISSSAAHESTNYQRLEFLGDSILKLLTSTNVAANHPYYTEGCLSVKESQIVSNARLCRAAIETGLDKFILTKAFTRAKWRPFYIEDLLKLDAQELGKRIVSTKTLADVVESLIGASYVDGGIDKALSCVRIFIPDAEWHTLDAARHILASQTNQKDILPSTLIPLEELLGYTFQNKMLAVEATTHSSWNLGSLTETCMERLEFIGDAILDNIIVSFLWSCGRNISHYEMSQLRAASVNADLLGFLMMEWSYSQEVADITQDKQTKPRVERVPIWKLMRHSSQKLSGAQSMTEENHILERAEILRAMREDRAYPWALLAHLQTPKPFSDLFESLVGAVWLDSGSMDVCTQMAERAGILPYLRRVLADGVDVVHPKNKLGELVSRSGKEVGYEHEIRRAGNVTKEWVCRVLVGEEVVVEVGGGVSREEIVTKAADEAYKLLRDRAAAKDEVMT